MFYDRAQYLKQLETLRSQRNTESKVGIGPTRLGAVEHENLSLNLINIGSAIKES